MEIHLSIYYLLLFISFSHIVSTFLFHILSLAGFTDEIDLAQIL